MHAIIRTRVTVAVIVFILFNMLVATVASASEKGIHVSGVVAGRGSAEEGTSRSDNSGRDHAGSLKSFVLRNLTLVQARVGDAVAIDAGSLECVSKTVRDQKAGACIITGIVGGNKESKALYAILVGESDENGGISIRNVEFLKQSN